MTSELAATIGARARDRRLRRAVALFTQDRMLQEYLAIVRVSCGKEVTWAENMWGPGHAHERRG